MTGHTWVGGGALLSITPCKYALEHELSLRLAAKLSCTPFSSFLSAHCACAAALFSRSAPFANAPSSPHPLLLLPPLICISLCVHAQANVCSLASVMVCARANVRVGGLKINCELTRPPQPIFMCLLLCGRSQDPEVPHYMYASALQRIPYTWGDRALQVRCAHSQSACAQTALM